MKNDTIAPAKPDEPEGGAETCSGAQPLEQIQAALRIVTGKWKGEILWQLVGGKRRFGALRRAIPGITQHMLTAQLRDLKRHGLVKRTIYAEVPPRVEYELTPAAQSLRTVFLELIRWSQNHAGELNLTAGDRKQRHD